MKERQIKRTEIYDGKVAKIVSDTVELENGKISEREIILHHGGVAIALKDSDGKYFMVRQYRYAHEKEMLEFCAGKLEEGEDPYDAVLRECKEELGYQPEEVRYLGKIIPTCGYSAETLYLYHGVKGNYVGQHFDIDEELKVEKYTLEEIEDMIRSGIIDDAKTVAILYYLELEGIYERK